MKTLYDYLREKMKEMKKYEEMAKNGLKNAPEGALRISFTRGHEQYYHLKNGENGKNGQYIQKKDEELARRLAQKEYEEKVEKLAGKRVRQFERILKDYSEDEIEQLYLREKPFKRKLIRPVVKSWEQRVREWKAVPYQGKGFSEDSAVIMTENGERVRSKSEKIIADYLFRKGIPYKYECPLVLKGFGTVYPDFTLLSRSSSEEIYLEHEGMMDDPEYAEKAVKKILLYEKNGILPGKRLLLTFETSHVVLDMKVLEWMLDSVL